jgi:hypothetical protein
MKFADESAWLTADKVLNEARSQEMLKLLSLYKYISFAINCFVKKHRYNKPRTYSATDTNFHWMERLFVGTMDSVNSSSDYFAY